MANRWKLAKISSAQYVLKSSYQMSEGIRETYIEQHVPYMLSCVTLLVPYNILNAYPKKMGTSLVIQWLSDS